MPLSKEEFTALRQAGLSPRQITWMGDEAARAELRGFNKGQAAVRGVQAGAVAPEPDAQASPAMMNVDPLSITGIGRRSLAALPDVGGFAGGMVPGPAGVALSGFGGSVGELGRQAGMGERIDPLRIAQAGAGQAGLTAMGLGLGSLAERVGTGLVKSAIGKPAKALAKKIAKRGLEGTERTIIRRKLANEEMADLAVKESNRRLKSVLSKAEKAGVEFDPGDVARSVFDKIESQRRYKIGSEDKKKLLDMTEEFLKDHPNPMSPESLNELKQRFGDLVYKGKVDPQARYSLTTEFNDAIRSVAKQYLEGRRPLAGASERRILSATKGVNEETEALGRAREALGEMGTHGPLRPAGAYGGGLNLPVLSAIGIPRSWALRGGLLAGGPGRQTATLSPRVLEALYNQATLEE